MRVLTRAIRVPGPGGLRKAPPGPGRGEGGHPATAHMLAKGETQMNVARVPGMLPLQSSPLTRVKVIRVAYVNEPTPSRQDRPSSGAPRAMNSGEKEETCGETIDTLQMRRYAAD